MPLANTETRAAAAADTPARLCTILFHGVAVAAGMVVVLPILLLPFTRPFAGRTAGVALFIAACVERMWAMYLRQGLGRACSGAGRDWTAIAVGYAYALTLGGSIAEFLVRQRPPHPGLVIGGLTFYGAGVALRYWAFQTLRHQWHVDVSETGGDRHLVCEGPYRRVRHPLYLGACLEIIGLPLFLAAGWALLFGTLVFIPLEVARALYEERFLYALFGADYRRYAAKVRGFFPFPR